MFVDKTHIQCSHPHRKTVFFKTGPRGCPAFRSGQIFNRTLMLIKLQVCVQYIFGKGWTTFDFYDLVLIEFVCFVSKGQWQTNRRIQESTMILKGHGQDKVPELTTITVPPTFQGALITRVNAHPLLLYLSDASLAINNHGNPVFSCPNKVNSDIQTTETPREGGFQMSILVALSCSLLNFKTVWFY